MLMTTLLFFGLGTQELLLIAFIFLLLFGAARIPELMRSLGKGVKGFKDEMNGFEKKADEPTDHSANKKE
mgnify:CR=1 FL=1